MVADFHQVWAFPSQGNYLHGRRVLKYTEIQGVFPMGVVLEENRLISSRGNAKGQYIKFVFIECECGL